MKKIALNFFKKVIGSRCPYCGCLIDYSFLDGLGNLIKFVFFKGSHSKYLKVSCSKCSGEYFVNINRPLELFWYFILFMGVSFNIFGWPTLLANYKVFYVLVVLVLLVYLGVTREVIKIKKD